MSLSRSLTAVVAAAATWRFAAARSCGNPPPNWGSQFPNASHSTVDVVIVGGGSSGTNAAIHLSDAGLSLLLIEMQAQLGGMVNSWTDQDTNTTYDYGVATYSNYTGTVDYFNRLGVETTIPTFGATDPYYIDFTTGETVNYTAPDITDEFAALGRYYNVCSIYQDLFLPSYANWPAPEDIPEDLLLPFREFVVKYDLSDAMLLIWAGIGAGLADMLDAPTLYVMQTFGPPTAGVFLGLEVQFSAASKRNQDIYDAAARILGNSVMLNSIVVDSYRLPNDKGVELLVLNQVTGKYTIVYAKRLVMAIEPTAANVKPFHLDAKESAIFDLGEWSVVHAGIVSHPSLPTDGIIYNLPPASADGNYFAYPEPPFVDYFEYIGPDLWQVIAVGWENFTVAEAQEMTKQAVQTLADAGTIPATNGTDLTIKAWSNHGAMDMRTSSENLKAGYIQNQYALQGYRSTYWTGAAFANQLSTYLWAYNTEYLVPLVLESFNSTN